MQRDYLSHNKPRRRSLPDVQPLMQRLVALAVVAILLIVVFSLLGERLLELYLQPTIGLIR